MQAVPTSRKCFDRKFRAQHNHVADMFATQTNPFAELYLSTVLIADMYDYGRFGDRWKGCIIDEPHTVHTHEYNEYTHTPIQTLFHGSD